jgi:phosphate-selective porin OprO/OprP
MNDLRRFGGRLRGLLPQTVAIRITAALAGATLGLLIALPAPAGAATLDELEQQIQALQGELSRMRNEIKSQSSRQAAAPQNTALKASGVEVTTKGGIKVKTLDGNFEGQIGGRVQVDYATYDEDNSNLGDGTELRRARIFVKGKLFRDWGFKQQIDFAGNHVSVKDSYLRYLGFAPANLTVGHFKEPFSLEEQTSSRFTTFMERGLPNAFVPGRSIGAMANTHGDNWTVAAGLFGLGVGDDVDGEGDEGWAATARATYAPIQEKTKLLHFGASGRFYDPADGLVRFRARPESHVTNSRLVDTGNLISPAPTPANVSDVADVVTYGIDTAGIWGPVSVQGEYIHNFVQRSGAATFPGNPGVDFNGWYAFASLFLTGESRNYSKGHFGRITPKSNVLDGGWGAWEIAGRFSSIDLTDANVLGGQQRDTTFALNWYPTSHVRVMANYIMVNTDNDATGNIANVHQNVANNAVGDDDPHIFQLRGQIDF